MPWLCWFPLSEYLFGATFGHWIMDFKVVMFDGSKPGIFNIIVRRFLDIIDFYMGFGILAMILIKNTQYHQRLGDIAANTIVIKTTEPQSQSSTSSSPS